MRALMLLLLALLAPMTGMAGCLDDPSEGAGDDPDDALDAFDGETAYAEPRVLTRDDHWMLRTDDELYLGNGVPVVEVASTTRTWIVEMEWTPTTVTAEEMVLAVSGEDGRLGTVEGPSPLRLVLDDPPGGRMLLLGYATSGNVAVDQGVTFSSSQFDGPVPDGYTLAG